MTSFATETRDAGDRGFGPSRGNLPGPSRRIVVEPIEVPAEPVQVPTETPAEPADEPVPAP
jgi:hypothetical protein